MRSAANRVRRPAPMLSRIPKDGAAQLSLLLSCRVIGRTAERLLLSELGRAAAERGCRALVGCYRATDRNALVTDLYPRLGFAPDGTAGDEQRYTLPLSAPGIPWPACSWCSRSSRRSAFGCPRTCWSPGRPWVPLVEAAEAAVRAA